MIILGVALTAILVIENMVLRFDAFIITWYTSAWLLSLVSVWIGIFIGYGIKWLTSSKNTNIDENYDF